MSQEIHIVVRNPGLLDMFLAFENCHAHELQVSSLMHTGLKELDVDRFLHGLHKARSVAPLGSHGATGLTVYSVALREPDQNFIEAIQSMTNPTDRRGAPIEMAQLYDYPENATSSSVFFYKGKTAPVLHDAITLIPESVPGTSLHP